MAGEETLAPVRIDRRQRVRRVVRRGLRFRVFCASDCRVRGRLRISRRQARELHLGRRARKAGRIGRSKVRTVRAGDSRRVTVKLRRGVRRQLRRAMRRADVRRLKARLVITIRTEDGSDRIRRKIVLRR